jgi:TonB family protein
MPVASSANPKPKYPALAVRNRIEGTVFVTFDVREDGTLDNIKILSGPWELRESVVSTLPLWRFTPAMLDGKPIRIRAMHMVEFQFLELRVR